MRHKALPGAYSTQVGLAYAAQRINRTIRSTLAKVASDKLRCELVRSYLRRAGDTKNTTHPSRQPP